MDLAQEFNELTTKFLFLSYNDEQNKSNMSELNTLLNDLNSLEYLQGNFVDKKTAARLIESFANIASQEETLIVKACCLLTVLMNKQKVELSTEQFKKLIEWQLKCLNFNFSGTACDILMSMHALFRNHPSYGKKYWDTLLAPDGLLLKYLSSAPQTTSEGYDTNSTEEIIIAIVYCIESLLRSVDPKDSDEQVDEIYSIIGGKLLNVLYSNRVKFNQSVHHMNFMTTSLNVLYLIASEDRDWCESNIGELLGIAKAYMHHGIADIPQVQPQKVHISQQSVLEQGSIESNNRGGKVAKTRKPRTVNKNRKSEPGKSKQPVRNEETVLQMPSGSKLRVEFETPLFNKTSDSDFSESEASRTRNERHKKSKLRLSAISLIGLIAKSADKKIFYGYWHCLFPTDTSAGLLTTAVRDYNARCRIAALQAASVILFSSRPFLLQAEWSEKPPSTFMPFSISLANMIIAMYEMLTQALASEFSLPVLTQILKCLTVLIQATPFHRLKTGLVTEFVKPIRKLVYHKDPTIQVAALMVMELLISTPDITTEISEVVGIPKTLIGNTFRNQNRLNDSGVDGVSIEADQLEEIIDSDCEDLAPLPPATQKLKKPIANGPQHIALKMSWLLQRVLENLGVIVTESKDKLPVATTPVRTECLQVLSSMAAHFSLLKDNLQFISAALKTSLNDSQADVRLYTAKCLDNLGHSMNTYLLEKGTPSSDELAACQNFWTSILPPVIEKIQDSEQSPALKSALCDFMSNIGVHVFERLSHTYHIQLIGLLSGAGCNEENTVRAAAVRALAVYVLFPSLRENLVFVENTAESIIQLIKDTNLFVRVRASWSMGNVSDALITNFFNSQIERISEDLLRRLLETAIDSASDNDKVRSNAVRTLGNLLRLITTDHLNRPAWRSLVQKAIEKLVNCMSSGGNAKVKWNSCYAIGNFMKNSDLFNGQHSDLNWPNLVFPSLCHLIVHHNNFKVRINGTAALITVQERSNYGARLQMVWSALLAAMEQSGNLTDFNEYKHRDNLQEQLCVAISHVIGISNDEDFGMLKTELIPKIETIKQIWMRVVNRILPENAAPLVSGALTLQEKLNQSDLTSERRNAVQILSSCFTQPIGDLY